MRSKNTKGSRNIWQCNKCAGDWMKAKHGTRMVQVITEEWMQQFILDEPPQALENKWRKDRAAYYARVEPQEAPRDKEPLLPGKEHKAIRLENDASDRMWKILLDKDAMHDEEQEVFHAEELKQRKEEAEEVELAENIEDSLLKVHMASAHMEGNKLVMGSIWVDYQGPADSGHTKP